MQTILFICTGNIFRSLVAEHALRLTLGRDQSIEVVSAGTIGELKPVPDVVQLELRKRGIEVGDHRPRKLTAQMLCDSSMAVAIGVDHREFVNRQFARIVPLFREICYGEMESVLDLWEVYPNWRSERDDVIKAYAKSTIDYIFDSMPRFILNSATPR